MFARHRGFSVFASGRRLSGVWQREPSQAAIRGFSESTSLLCKLAHLLRGAEAPSAALSKYTKPNSSCQSWPTAVTQTTPVFLNLLRNLRSETSRFVSVPLNRHRDLRIHAPSNATRLPECSELANLFAFPGILCVCWRYLEGTPRVGSRLRRPTRLSTRRLVDEPSIMSCKNGFHLLCADKSGNVLANLKPIETENWIHFREPR